MDTLVSTVDPLVLTLRFAAALGLGVLLGMERERTKTPTTFGGVRTLDLLALSGGVAAFDDESLARPLLALAIFVAAAGLVIVSYRVTAERGEIGVTTEVSALLAFLLCYLCVRGYVTVAAGLAVASGGVLALKGWLRAPSSKIETADVEATLKFAIVSIIILPLVPNQNFGPAPLDAINSFMIWLMVALISGLNFASYVLVKILGAEHGIGLTGLLGGLVSSTERLPNAFIRRGSGDGATELAAIAALRAAPPPHGAGAFALLDAAPNVDVLVVAHSGLEGLASLADIARLGVSARKVRVRLWRAPRPAIPESRYARVLWQYGEWARVDAFVAAAAQ